MDDHSILSPSGSGIWCPCAGSVRLTRNLPPRPSGAAAEVGTAAHEVIEIVLKKWVDASTSPLPRVIGNTMSNGVIVTEEMYDACKVFIDHVLRLCNERGLLRALHIEERIEIPRIHPAMFGTCDLWVFDQARGELFIYDYKHGRTLVEVEENKQLICYYAGIVDLLPDLAEQFITVHFHIVQPNGYHPEGPIRKWSIKATDLRAHVNYLESRAAEAMSDNPTLTPGNQCTWCDARHICPSLRAAAYAAEDYTLQAIPDTYSIEALGREYKSAIAAAKITSDRLNAIEVELLTRIEGGESGSGYVIDQKPGRLEWTSEAGVVAAMGDMLGFELRKPLDVITPTQAKGLGLPEATLAGLAKRGSGGKTLKPADQTLAARAFSGGSHD